MTKSTNLEPLWDDKVFAKATKDLQGTTGLFAEILLKNAGLDAHKKDAPLIVFDNACGGAIVAAELQSMVKGRPQDTFEVVCGDFASPMVDIAKQRIEKEGWKNTSVAKIDAEDTKLPSDHFTHVFTNIGFAQFNDPSAALSECYRLLQPGGTLGFTTWETAPWYPDLKIAMESIPELPKLPETVDIPNAYSKLKIWHDPEAVQKFVAEHKFVDVQSKIEHRSSVISNLEQQKSFIKSPLKLITTTYWTQEQRDKLDNQETYDKIDAWYEKRLQKGPLERNWSAVVTVATKPKN